MKCPSCEIGNLVSAVRNMPYTYKGKKTLIKAVKGQYCDKRKCGEVVLDMGESVRTSREMIEFNKKVNAGLTPIDLLTEVRRQFSLTQQEAAKVFGGGPNAFSRYESGKTKPPVALVKLFTVLKRHPEHYKEIALGGAWSASAESPPAKAKRRSATGSAHV